MSKEIKMDYEEYEDMVRIIALQKSAIDEFKKSDKTVLVDWRYGDYRNKTFNCGFIPIVIGNKDAAKEYLKEEFDRINAFYGNELSRLRAALNEANQKNEKKRKFRLW